MYACGDVCVRSRVVGVLEESGCRVGEVQAGCVAGDKSFRPDAYIDQQITGCWVLGTGYWVLGTGFEDIVGQVDRVCG